MLNLNKVISLYYLLHAVSDVTLTTQTVTFTPAGVGLSLMAVIDFEVSAVDDTFIENDEEQLSLSIDELNVLYTVATPSEIIITIISDDSEFELY